MRKPIQLPPGIEAAAFRFAKACQRDGHGKNAAYVRVREGLPRVVCYFDNDGTQHLCQYISDDKWEEIDDD